MKKITFTLIFLLGTLFAAQAQQSVTIKIDAGSLDNTTGMATVPTGGLLQLIASTTGTFSAPTSTSYVSGDNVLVASFAMNMTAGSGETFNAFNSLPLTNSSGMVTSANFTLGGNYALTTGETLELRFYPSLTYASMPASPTLGTTFGQVSSSTIEFGSSGGVPTETAWVVPSSGSNVTFEYVTVSNGGTYANTTADATNIVLAGTVPEPMTYTLVAGMFVGSMSLRVWNRRCQALPLQ